MKTSLIMVTWFLGISCVRAVTPSLAPPPDNNPSAPISPTPLPASAPAPGASTVPAPLVTPAPSVAPVPDATPTSANLPTPGFAPGRYEALWTKSPFAVATSETVGAESPDYFLVGVANQDGIFYASVIERQNQEHFLLTSDKPVRGLTLKSINRSGDGQNTYAEVLKDGQPLTLKLEQAPAAAGGVSNAANMSAPGAIPMPGGVSPQMPMPGMPGGAPGFPASQRPFTRFHRPPIRLPPGNPQGAPAAPAAAPANSPNPTPPPPQ